MRSKIGEGRFVFGHKYCSNIAFTESDIVSHGATSTALPRIFSSSANAAL